MNSISDLGLQQILLNGFQRAQNGAETRQIQVSTGKVSDRYSGIGEATSRLLSAEGVVARAGAYEKAADAALSTLQIHEANLSVLEESVADLRDALVRSLATGASELLGPEISSIGNRVVAALNAQTGGVFVFGGVDGASPPVDVKSFADVVAVDDLGGLFQSAERARLVVEEGVTVDGGATAEQVGAGLLGALRALARAPAALGPFEGALTDRQRQFVVSSIEALDGVADTVVRELGVNGLSQGQASDAKNRSTAARDLAEVVAAEIEDVDLAEAISRLNQDQIAIEAAGRALAQASQLSLLNFI